MSEVDAHTPNPKRRILFRLFRGFLILVVLLIVTYLIADQILLRKVQHQREAFKERFGAVDFRDFIPERPAPEEDAGRVYRYAVGLMAKADEQYGDWSMYDALTKGPEAFDTRGRGAEPLPTQEEVDAKVREKMAAMEEAFRAVEEAQALTRGSVVEETNFEAPPFELNSPLQLSRNVAAKAVMDSKSGDIAGASRWLKSGLRMAATINNVPTITALMVRVGCVERSLIAAEQVMNATDSVLPLNEGYWAMLDSVLNREVLRRNLASEAAYGLSRELPFPRLLMSANQLRMIEFWFALDSALALNPSSARRKQLDSFSWTSSGPMLPTNCFVPLFGPSVMRTIDGFDRMAARCDFVRLAVALRSWKQDHGTYPDSLEAFTPTAQAAPRLDPFTGESYHYRREGEGFVLYSVGTDRKDDGGVKVEDRKSGGDIVWTCVR